MRRERATLGELVSCCGGDIRTGPFGSQLHQHDYVDDPAATPVVMPKDMIDGRVEPSSIARVDDETVDRLKQHVLREGDIVLARRGEIGRRAWIGADEGGWLCGTGSMRISLRSCPRVRSRYLYYYLATEAAVGWLEGHAVGATMSNLSAGVVQKLPIEFPTLHEQDGIVGFLDAVVGLIDNNRRRIEVLEEMARLIYREWFVHFRFPGHEDVELVDSDLGPIPRGWETKAVDDVADLVRGRSYRGTDLVKPPEGRLFLNLKCIDRGGGFRKSGLKRYNGPFKEQQLALPGDTVIAVTDMTQERNIVAQAGRVPNLSEGSGVISLDLARVLPRHAINGDYLYAMFRYSNFSNEVKEHANGTNVLHLSPDRIREFRFAVSPPELQKSFRDAVRPMYDLVDNLALQKETLAQARDLLLPRLISGELDVSDLDLDLELVG